MKNLLFIAAIFILSTNSQAQEGVTVKGNTITMKDIGPVWPGCEKSELSAGDCFNKLLAKHVTSNFKYPKDANGKIVRGKSIITFYIDENGKPLTAREFLEKLIGELPAIYKDEAHLRKIWSNPDTRADLLIKLGDLGFDNEQLNDLRNMIASPECDIFDVLSHISFSSQLMTRKQRVEFVKGEPEFFEVYKNLEAREFLQFVLQHYEDYGIEELQRDKLGDLVKLKLGTPKDAKIAFGNMKTLLGAYYKLQENIYRAG
jgi:type I restriction enzyme R subunit